MFNMGLGEVAPGGVGSGLYGMLVLAVMTVFVAGLMVGRTPEYLRKKITAREIKLVSLYILTMPLIVLIGAGDRDVVPDPAGLDAQRRAARALRGALRRSCRRPTTTAPRSPALSANTPFYNTALGLAMLLGRFVPMIFVLGLAGSLARQQQVPRTGGTLPTHGPLFVGMLTGVAVIVAGLTFFPVLALGPLAEGLLMSTLTHAPIPRRRHRVAGGLLDPRMLVTSLPDAVRKLDPRVMARNPVMFVVEVGAVFSTVAGRDATQRSSPGRSWSGSGSPWSSPTWPRPWPRAAARRRPPRLRRGQDRHDRPSARPSGSTEEVPATQLLPGDRVVVVAGQVIPGDGDVVEGIASVDESAITGESAPVIRESGGDRCSVTGGTRVLSDRIVVRSPPSRARASSTG